MGFTLRTAVVVAIAFSGLAAGDLSGDVQAKFIKILASSAGSAGKVACSDGALAGELGKVGVAVDAGSKVAWASSEGQVKSLKGAGKMVICGNLQWLPSGGAIAIVEEGGKPQIYLNMGNIAASGVTLSDAVLKIGKKLN
jgi:hypothetical protein